MNLIKMIVEDMSGKNIVLYIEKSHPVTKQIFKVFETYYFDNGEYLEMFINFHKCKECRKKSYKFINNFAILNYVGDSLKQAMCSRI